MRTGVGRREIHNFTTWRKLGFVSRRGKPDYFEMRAGKFKIRQL